MKHLFWIIATIILFASCKEEICITPKDNLATLSFFTTNNGEIKDTTFTGLYAKAEGGLDTLLVENSTVSSIQFPLNPQSDSITLVLWATITLPGDTSIEYKDTTRLNIYYERHIEFVSYACGAVTEYEITGGKYLKDGLLDSIAIFERYINEEANTNFGVFLHP